VSAAIHEPCPACGGDGWREEALRPVAADRRRWSYDRCRGCGLLVLRPLPDMAQIAGFYDRSYYGDGSTKLPGWVQSPRRAAIRWRAKGLGRLLPRPAAALDIGCGDGTFLAALAEHGMEITGNEIEGPALERASHVPGILLLAGPITDHDLPPAHFSLISLWHVLEHLPDPLATLRHCRRALREDGLLLVEVPNAASWQARLFGDRWLHLDPPRHLYQFTPRAMTSLFHRAGFRVRQRRFLSIDQGSFGVVQSVLNSCLSPRDLLLDLLRSRGRCPGPPGAKAISLALAPALAPFAAAWSIAEAMAGAGAVLRFTGTPGD
jgi:SAM-dependent methyltransferase